MKDFEVPMEAQRYTTLGKHLKKIYPQPKHLFPKKKRNHSDNGEYSQFFKGFPFSQRNGKKRDKEDSKIS